MRFKGLDLNLLVAFEALMELRNVTRTAERLGLSQPAVSAALSRLRDYFGDPLLIVHGKRFYPTALAQRLTPQVRACLEAAETLVTTSSSFDPATAERAFRIIASDYIVAAVLARMVRRLARESPKIAFQILMPDEISYAGLSRGEVDLMIAPAEFLLPQLPRELLYEERHVVVGWNENPLLARPISEQEFLNAGLINVAIGPNQQKTFADGQMQLLGFSPRVEVGVASFTMVPWMLLGTDRLALMHERLAEAMSAHFDLIYQDLPFEFPIMREMAQYHQIKSADEGLRWLIELIQSEAADRQGIQSW